MCGANVSRWEHGGFATMDTVWLRFSECNRSTRAPKCRNQPKQMGYLKKLARKQQQQKTKGPSVAARNSTIHNLDLHDCLTFLVHMHDEALLFKLFSSGNVHFSRIVERQPPASLAPNSTERVHPPEVRRIAPRTTTATYREQTSQGNS